MKKILSFIFISVFITFNLICESIKVYMVQIDNSIVEADVDLVSDSLVLSDLPTNKTVTYKFNDDLSMIRTIEIYKVPYLNNFDFLYQFKNVEKIYIPYKEIEFLYKFGFDINKMPNLKIIECNSEIIKIKE